MSRVVHHEVSGAANLFQVVLPRCGTVARRHGYVLASGDTAKVTCKICLRMIYAASIQYGKANRP